MKHIIQEYPERYYIGIELENGFALGENNRIGELWDSFLQDDIHLLPNDMKTTSFIGLECYPPDFMETKRFDYFAMMQTPVLIKQNGFATKKLPAGRYISFEIPFDHIVDSIHNCYKYIQEKGIKVHMGFDFEDYLEGQDYRREGAILHFSLLLEKDE